MNGLEVDISLSPALHCARSIFLHRTNLHDSSYFEIVCFSNAAFFMSKFEAPRPEYDAPPVIEVVLSFQFEPLAELKAAQFGLLWAQFRKEFPRIEEHPPIAPVTENFELSARERFGLQIEMSEIPLLPRTWFLNETGTELIQVQRDRFIHNWRKTDKGQAYPRY